MRSSRMRTVRNSSCLRGGMSAPGGRCLLWGVSAPRGGVCSWGGVCSQGGACSWGGVCSWGWGVVSQLALRQNPPCGQTDMCKNITFATSLRTVKKKLPEYYQDHSEDTDLKCCTGGNVGNDS